MKEPSLLQSHPHLFTHRSLPALERSSSELKVRHSSRIWPLCMHTIGRSCWASRVGMCMPLVSCIVCEIAR